MVKRHHAASALKKLVDGGDEGFLSQVSVRDVWDAVREVDEDMVSARVARWQLGAVVAVARLLVVDPSSRMRIP
jgi:hypothetical protein